MKAARPNRSYRTALFLDRRIGPLVCAFLALGKPVRHALRSLRQDQPVRKVLIVKFWGIGSLVLASPLFAELKRQYPDAEIDVLTLRENESVLRLYPAISRRLTLHLGGGVLRFLRDTALLLLRVRRERYDLLLDLEFFTRFSAAFSFLARAQKTQGFSSKGSARGRLHDVEFPFNGYCHVTANFLALLDGEPMKSPPALDRALLLPRLEPGAAARTHVAAVLESHPAWRAGFPLVVFNPNAGDMALERRWPAEPAALLLAGLVGRGDLNVALTGSQAEAPYVQSVAAASGVAHRLVDLAGRISIEELIALLERADVFVTNDSGPLHIACATGTPTVALFGPETPVLYGPLTARAGQRHRVHYKGLACSPCMFVHDNKVLTCWFAQAECMSQIRPADVLASVEDLLGVSAAPKRTSLALANA
ncbi:MAG TPA: glycosyltransferase family 9 protein [Myxococcota bacterium]|nr:glycosyltransferase family 9 protein [Myxococcota bacterium]